MKKVIIKKGRKNPTYVKILFYICSIKIKRCENDKKDYTGFGVYCLSAA